MRGFKSLPFVLPLLFASSIYAAEYAPRDWAGASVTISGTDNVIWGEHRNISRFTVVDGASVRVKAYDGDPNSGVGWVSIEAITVSLSGTIDASGAGFTGGGGGGGGRHLTEDNTEADAGGVGSYAGFAGEDGALFPIVDPAESLVPGGNGSRGGGLYGGARGYLVDGGGELWPPKFVFGAPGGYDTVGGNTDETIDFSLLMGSGGGGNAGEFFGVSTKHGYTGTGASGLAGGNGSGVVRILVRRDITVTATGRILAEGRWASTKNALPSLHREPAEPSMLIGGGGAGGGIFLDLRRATYISFNASALLSTEGTTYPDPLANGGTVKVALPESLNPSLPRIVAGRMRVHTHWESPASVAVDHGGQPLTLADGDTLQGEHFNISEFHIPAGATVKVPAHEGSDGSGLGWLRIGARRIVIEGTIDANGAGYTGGGGGGNGSSCIATWPSPGCESAPRAARPGGLSRYYGFDGARGAYNIWTGGGGGPGTAGGGKGGNGDGAFGGAGGSYLPGGATSTRQPGEPGGYADFAANGDSTTNTLVWMGSGAGGNVGFTSAMSGVALAGGGGGGALMLSAIEHLELGPNARLLTQGRYAQSIDVEPQVDRDPAPESDAAGAGGAGGGILLECPFGTTQFHPTAFVSARGTTYPDPLINGGTVKVFRADPKGTLPAIEAGRFYESQVEVPLGAVWILR